MLKPDPVEIVAIAIPVLAEAIAVMFTIGSAIIIVALLTGAA